MHPDANGAVSRPCALEGAPSDGRLYSSPSARAGCCITIFEPGMLSRLDCASSLRETRSVILEFIRLKPVLYVGGFIGSNDRIEETA